MSNPQLIPSPRLNCLARAAWAEDGGAGLLISPQEKLFGELLVDGGLIAVGEHLQRHKVNNNCVSATAPQLEACVCINI